MKQHLNKKIKSEFAFSLLALFSISGLLLIQNSDKKIQNVAFATEASVTTSKCTDSDNGIDYFKKGTVIFDLFGSGNTDFQKTDECSTTVAGQLTEYKCVNNVWSGTTYQCPNGCKDGACINDDVSIKDFSVASVSGAWKASGHIQKTSGNNVVIWASLDGGTAKQIGNEIAADGSFYFTPSKYWTLGVGKHTIKIEAKPTLADPTLPNTAEASFTVVAPDNSYTLPNNTIIKLPGDNRFYALINGKKVTITNISDLAKYGYSISEIKKIAKEYGLSTTESDSGTKQEIIGDITTGRIYKIINGKKIWIPTITAFNAQGLKWEEVKNQSDTNSYTETRLIKDTKGNIYFITNNGKKKLIINTEVFNSYGNKTEDVVEVSDEFLNSIETVKLVKENGSNKIYMITGNKKQWIKNIQAFIRLKLRWEDIDIVNSTEINTYTEGVAIE